MNDKLTILMLIALILAGCVLPVVTYDPSVSPISPVSPVFRSMGVLSVDEDQEPLSIVEVRPDWARVPDGASIWVECQLRRGGSLGVISNQAFCLNRNEVVFTNWKTDGLEPGWYELFCRAHQGETLIPGVFNAQSQDCTEGCGFGFISHWEVK